MTLLAWPLLVLGTWALTWLFSYWTFLGATPNLALALTIGIALRFGAPAAQTFGFLAGLGVDALSVRLFGAEALVLSTAGWAVGTLRRQMDTTEAPSQMALVGLLSWVHFLLYGLVGRVFAGSFEGRLLPGLVLLPLYNALLAPAAFGVAERLRGRERGRWE